MKSDLNGESYFFSRELCLKYDNSMEDLRCIVALLDHLTLPGSRFAFFGANDLCKYFLEAFPDIRESLVCILDNDPDLQGTSFNGVLVCRPEVIPPFVNTVFLCETRWLSLQKMAKMLPPQVRVVTLDSLAQINSALIPQRARVPKVESIYPIDIPKIEFMPNQDMILIDLPARSIAQMPAGFAYVHNALKKTGIQFQTVDLDIIVYHRYHAHRILDGLPEVKTQSGFVLPEDPWQSVHYLLWENQEFLEYFRSDIDEISWKLIQAKPKIIGISLQQANIHFARLIVNAVRKELPDVLLVVGGMSCLQPEAAKIAMPEADYTVVGEADLTVGPLVQALLRGERPRDLPGVWSCYDTPNRDFTPGIEPIDLDALEFPHYEWTDVKIYRNWNGYQLTPIIGSRGCHWAKCRFCAERFHWRTRSPEKIVEELEWLYQHGFTNFVFNESDLHGEPELIERVCDGIIRHGMKISMTAQLRCHPKIGKEYFKKLHDAGFGCLRFGVDGGSVNTLRREFKGYSKTMILNNLRDSAEAGISNEVNLVLGIPGETEEDIDETIQFFTDLKPYIWRLAFINPLMLFRGSIYWDSPEEFGIKFRGNKEELYKNYLVAIPDDAWYSIDPYIDREVRYARLKKVVTSMQKIGMPLGDFAEFTTEQLDSETGDLGNTHNAKDGSRSLKEFTIAKPSGLSIPVLLETDYKGYNIVLYQKKVFALAISLGPIDLPYSDDETIEKYQEQRTCFIANTKEDVKKLVDHFESPEISQLIDTNYHGFNIYKFYNNYYAFALALEPVDLMAIGEQKLLEYLGAWDCFISTSQGEVKQLIDQSITQPKPDLFEENFEGFNLFVYQGLSFALEKAHFRIELIALDEATLQKKQAEGVCFVAESIEEVKRIVLEHKRRFDSNILPKGKAASSLSLPSIDPANNLLPAEQTINEAVENSLHAKQLLDTINYSLIHLQGMLIEKDRQITSLQQRIGVLKSTFRMAQVQSSSKTGKQKALFFRNVSEKETLAYLEVLQDYEVTVLGLKDPDLPSIDNLNLRSITDQDTWQGLIQQDFDVVVIPYAERLHRNGINLVAIARQFSKPVLVLSPNGRVKLYNGEDVHRLQYNSAYLSTLFNFIPNLKNKTVLEVGCSDGLVCDFLLNEDPERIVGIDVLEEVGRNYSDPKISYAKMGATSLLFPDEQFDVSYSIATLEHIQDPFVVLQEMKRVTKKGGIFYVQAGPLYHSPFGHHMFGYFDSYPWIHLRLSQGEIVEYSKRAGIDKEIERNTGRDIEGYIAAYLNPGHINSKFLSEYRLDEFRNSPDVELLFYHLSVEGETLLTPSIQAELSHIQPEDLIAHGFEIVFRRK